MKPKPANAAEQLFGYIPRPREAVNPVLHRARLPVSLPVKSGVPDLPSKGMLKVVGYVHGRVTLCAYQGGSRKVGKRLMLAKLEATPTAVPNLEPLRKTRRMLKVGNRWREKPLPTSFTSRARNMLKDAGALIENHCQGVGLFLTLTFPGGTNEAFEACGIASGYIADRLNRWLRYKVDNGWFGYVWELQKRGAPHLHYLFRMPSGTDFVAFYSETRAQWRKILLDVSEETGVDLFKTADGNTHRHNPNLPGINFAVIHQGLAGYLAKYASKTKTKNGILSPFTPGRWWGVSYAVRKEVLMRRVSFILGTTSIERANERLVEIVDRLAHIVKSQWRPDGGEFEAGTFVSLALGDYSAGYIAGLVRAWLGDGDLTALEELEAIPPVVSHAPE